MGKRSREKRERKERGEIRPKREKPEKAIVNICLTIARWGTYLSLFAPLIFAGGFFFPFVGPKSIYFMALAEIVFFAWLILVIFSKKYRPRFNALSIALILFLVVLIAATIFGLDPSRSFWSKYERMTGLLMWFHLFGFFLAISSTFQKKSDWHKIFGISISVSILISFISFLAKGVPLDSTSFLARSRQGATLGNSSFMGTYLLFNVFLALYLFFENESNEKKSEVRIFSLAGVIIGTLAIFFADARAAGLSLLGGLILLFLFWLIFTKQGKSRWAGILLLIIFAAGVFGFVYLSMKEGSIVYEKVGQLASKSRYLVWQNAWQGFLEKPWLGWGPENFEISFPKYYDPRLAIPEYGSEVWFDRAHNIVLDTMVTSGIIGMIFYLGIFIGAFYLLWKGYFKKQIHFWIAGIFSVVLISYFVQNLTVFDMVSSYLMWFLILGFIAAVLPKKELLSQTTLPLPKKDYSSLKSGAAVLVLVLFILSFFNFVIKPAKADSSVIKSISNFDPGERTALYKETLKISPLGKYQIREFFSETMIEFFYQKESQKSSLEDIAGEFDFVSQELQKSIKESPLDYKPYLKLGTVYNVWVNFDPTKIALAEEILNKATELSPRNQQTYWALAQTKLYQQDFPQAVAFAQKTVDLEPRFKNAHLILVQVAQLIGDNDLAKQKAKEALEIDPSWYADFKDILEQ